MHRILAPLALLCVLVSMAETQEPVADTLTHYLAAMVGDISGQVSLDGRYITFVDWSTGNLAVHEIATGANRHLTHKGTWLDSDDYALGARISSDNRSVAFGWYNREAQRTNEPDLYELRVVGMDGSGERLLYGEQAVDVRPLDWSPDGTRVLASLKPKDGPYQLVWVPLAAGDVQVVKTLADHAPLAVRGSPDGRSIAYDYPATDDAAKRTIACSTGRPTASGSCSRAIVRAPRAAGSSRWRTANPAASRNSSTRMRHIAASGSPGTACTTTAAAPPISR
jgi:hypothetical protein